MVKITEYWNKVVDDTSAPFGRRVLRDEYEVKSTHTADISLAELKKRWKSNKRMIIGPDFIREDKGSPYGIHSYIMIKGVP